MDRAKVTEEGVTNTQRSWRKARALGWDSLCSNLLPARTRAQGILDKSQFFISEWSSSRLQSCSEDQTR